MPVTEAEMADLDTRPGTGKAAGLGVLMAAGLGLANGPASSASTSAVAPEEVGLASGISNSARYVGGSPATAATSPGRLPVI
jgi:hypothetical protein